jgi:AAA domain
MEQTATQIKPKGTNMSFQIKPASRVGINPLIAAYSESGCGKTFSALLLARGLAGPAGKIVVADSESGRASLYADIPTIGGFETFDLCAPFSPARYVEAVDAIENSGAAVGIIDSGSHEWEGVGGVLDMAGEVEQRTGKTGLHCWKTPKFEHAKFIQRLLRTKIPFIICLRAKYKSRQVKENGKTVILKDETTSPIQAEDFIFEATCHFEILQNHSIILTKCSHPSLRDCFPKDKTTPITIEHGRALAAWCNAAGKPAVAPSPAPAPKQSGGNVDALKKELWKITTPHHRGNAESFRQYLIDDCDLSPDKLPSELTAPELENLIVKAKGKL